MTASKWCRGWGSNPQGLLRRILSPLRLPIPPPRLISNAILASCGASFKEKSYTGIMKLKNIFAAPGFLKHVLAFVIMLGGGLAGAVMLSRLAVFVIGSDSAGFAALGGAILGIVLGYPLGLCLSMVWLRYKTAYSGSARIGGLGAVLGGVLTLGLAEVTHLNQNSDWLFMSFFISVPLLALLGYRLKSIRRRV